MNPILYFSRNQLKGLFLLGLLIVVVQGIYFFTDFDSEATAHSEKQQWLSLQSKIDSLKLVSQAQTPKIYPFNPNFISDYKAYQLGLSVVEINRLQTFRAQGKFVNSAKEFQAVTKISDSLLQKISLYFKFPDWVHAKKQNVAHSNQTSNRVVKTDLNQATKNDLMAVSGIGEALSERILQQKQKLGAYVSVEQLAWIYGISPEVVARLQTVFEIKQTPAVRKLNINEANLKELADFPYFNYALARDIITFRTMQGNEIKKEDLTKIKDFPTDKLHTIALYLHF